MIVRAFTVPSATSIATALDALGTPDELEALERQGYKLELEINLERRTVELRALDQHAVRKRAAQDSVGRSGVRAVSRR